MIQLLQSPSTLLTSLKIVFSRLTDSSTHLLPFIPKPRESTAQVSLPYWRHLSYSVKLLLLLIILANSPSLPFLWHLRVWYTPLKAYFLVYTRGRERYLTEWKRKNERKGGIKLVTRLKRIAWIDDCDYNLHLSNS